MTKLLTYGDIKALGIPQSLCQINRLIKGKKFPKPIRMGGKTSRPLWPESEVREWLDKKLAERGEVA